MNQLEFARIHEMQFHGDIRFHLRLHEMTKELSARASTAALAWRSKNLGDYKRYWTNGFLS